MKGSASVLHVATGLYLTGAYVNQDNDLPASAANTTLWYVQGGVSKNWTGLGNTVVYGEYTKINDAVLEPTRRPSPPGSSRRVGCTVWGLGIVQHVDAAAMEVFLSYRNFSADVVRLEHRGLQRRDGRRAHQVLMPHASVRPSGLTPTRQSTLRKGRLARPFFSCTSPPEVPSAHHRVTAA